MEIIYNYIYIYYIHNYILNYIDVQNLYIIIKN